MVAASRNLAFTSGAPITTDISVMSFLEATADTQYFATDVLPVLSPTQPSYPPDQLVCVCQPEFFTPLSGHMSNVFHPD